jgi:hypothetical protein
MRYDQLIRYIKTSEGMIEPDQVARVNQASTFLRRLPLPLQKRIARKGSEKNPYMGFVVEPYAFFLSFGIRDIEEASRILPPGYRLVPVSMFDGGEPRPAAIIGAFNIHTSVFWGSRLELYLIAENENTGMMSWIIAEYESNTISFDPGQGFIAPSAERSVVTTSFKGEVIVDVLGRASRNQLTLVAGLQGSAQAPLDQRLWVEGNLSVDYGGGLEGKDSQPFGLIFDPGEMASALKVPLQNLRIEKNSLGARYLEARPFEVACFPFAQHFVTTSMPVDIGLRDAAGLEAAAGRFADGMERGPRFEAGLAAAEMSDAIAG